MEETYDTKKPFHIAVSGINNTFFDKISGLPRRLRLFFNGIEFDYSQRDWIKKKDKFLFDARITPVIVESEIKTMKNIQEKIILRSGLNTLQVVVSDGVGKNQEQTRTFYMISH